EVEVLGAGEPTKQRHAFRNHSDLALHFDRIRNEIESEDLYSPGSWGEQTGKHFDSSRFAGSIGAEESEELAGNDVEIHVFYSSQFTETAVKLYSGDGKPIHEISDSSMNKRVRGLPRRLIAGFFGDYAQVDFFCPSYDRQRAPPPDTRICQQRVKITPPRHSL